MNIDQKLVDSVFSIRFKHCGEYTDKIIIEKIKSILKRDLNVDLSFVEAHNFWKWRSEKYDASFLNFISETEVVEFFTKFIKESINEDDEDDEDDIYYFYE